MFQLTIVLVPVFLRKKTKIFISPASENLRPGVLSQRPQRTQRKG